MDIPHGTRPKSTELIYSAYNTFPTFLSREIDIVSGRSISNIVAKPAKVRKMVKTKRKMAFL